MEKAKILGRRIKYFRNRAGISQLDLETSIDAAYGSISRIENGSVNPSKETLDKIIKALEITGREIDYVKGDLFYPASELEVDHAIKEAQEYFDHPNVLAYMLDDRYRLVYISDSFYALFGKEKETWNITNKTLFELLLEDRHGVRALFNRDNFDDLMFGLIQRFYVEAGYMEDDELVSKSIKLIEEVPKYKELWNKQKMTKMPFYTPEKRKIHFIVNGQEVVTTYSIEPLLKYPRFEIIDYTAAE